LSAEEAGWFPVSLRRLYEEAAAQLLQAWPRFAARLAEFRQLTLVHFDAYFVNFLCPKPGHDGPAYLIDWQSPWVAWGAIDLALLIAAFWTPAQRHAQQREERMLRHYYRTLRVAGVEHYDWNELLMDYRLGLVYWLFGPVQDRADGSPQSYWWPKLRCLAAAYTDWRCAELLER
jgi:thiamine kinase-like enzyme